MGGEMRVYTSVNDYNYSTNVGVVLVGDKDQVYMEDGFKLTIQDKASAHVYGLKRAISFVKNVKPLFCNKGMLQIFQDNIRVDMDREVMDRINSDEYIQRFIEQRNIKIVSQRAVKNSKINLNSILFHNMPCKFRELSVIIVLWSVIMTSY